MKVLLIEIGTFNVTTLASVSSITYNDVTNVYTIVNNGASATYSGATYKISILW